MYVYIDHKPVVFTDAGSRAFLDVLPVLRVGRLLAGPRVRRREGASVRTFVIADVGCTHQGDLAAMKRLVQAVADSGADVCKFQWLSSAERLCERRHAPSYLDAYRWLEFPAGWHDGLRAACDKAEISYMATCFLPEDVAVVAPYVRHFKVAAFEAQARDLIRAHEPFLLADADRWLIVSLGMGATAYDVTGDWQTAGGNQLKLLHCVSSYPAPLHQLNIRRISEQLLDGFSDHSDPSETWTGALAVACGARIVEAHIRLDDTDPANPDYPHAMTPAQFGEYVAAIRDAERCLGTGTNASQPCEAAMQAFKVEARDV